MQKIAFAAHSLNLLKNYEIFLEDKIFRDLLYHHLQIELNFELDFSKKLIELYLQGSPSKTTKADFLLYTLTLASMQHPRYIDFKWDLGSAFLNALAQLLNHNENPEFDKDAKCFFPPSLSAEIAVKVKKILAYAKIEKEYFSIQFLRFELLKLGLVLDFSALKNLAELLFELAKKGSMRATYWNEKLEAMNLSSSLSADLLEKKIIFKITHDFELTLSGQEILSPFYIEKWIADKNKDSNKNKNQLPKVFHNYYLHIQKTS